VTCEDCRVAVFIAYELRFFGDGDPAVPAIAAKARKWHRKCLNWRGKNRRGCTCTHAV
jgi:hypothetical protein